MDWNVIGYPLCFLIGIAIGRYVIPKIKQAISKG